MKNVNNKVTINTPSIKNALVEKQRRNDLASTNENNSNTLADIITKPSNIEEVASLLEAYFEEITSQNTTAQMNNSQVTQRSAIVSTPFENETIGSPLRVPALNGRNSENELAVEDEPADSTTIPEWSLNVGEPTELIVVKQFAETYATAFEQEISEIRNASSRLTKTQYREIAEKCRRV